MKLIRGFISLPLREKWLFAEALAWLYLAKLMLMLLPFRRCVPLIKQTRKPVRHPDIDLLIRVKHAVRRADKLALWKNACLVKSIAARWMLNRRNISSQLFFGVRAGEMKKIAAHAWITAAHMEVVPKAGDYQVLLRV